MVGYTHTKANDLQYLFSLDLLCHYCGGGVGLICGWWRGRVVARRLRGRSGGRGEAGRNEVATLLADSLDRDTGFAAVFLF